MGMSGRFAFPPLFPYKAPPTTGEQIDETQPGSSVKIFDRGPRRVFIAMALALALLALFPVIDLAVARLFYGAHGFIGENTTARFARDFFRVTPYTLLVLSLLAWQARRMGFPVPWAPSGRAAMFLLLTMAIGPGLIVNAMLKEHSHRPRPVHLVEFGGPDAFRPWHRFDGACERNCSFASGEAAQGFWMVAPALLVPAPYQGVAVAGAVAFGVGASALRLAFGGHFLSDVIAGALIILIVIFALRRRFGPPGQAA